MPVGFKPNQKVAGYIYNILARVAPVAGPFVTVTDKVHSFVRLLIIFMPLAAHREKLPAP